MNDKINIRGVYFNNVTFDEAVSALITHLEGGTQCALYTPNSEIVQACLEDSSLLPIINSAEMIVPDGIGVVKAGKILSTPFCGGKVAGIEVGEELIRRLQNTAHRIYFLGGKPGVAEQAIEKLSEKYPGVSFAGCHDGYFDKEGEENAAVVSAIQSAGADVLFVCLGAPAQEKWIYQNRASLPDVKVFLGLGGSLDGYAGIVKRAPKIFIKLGLEWFYRLITDPRRFKRMLKLPKFYFGTWKYKLFHKD